MAANVGDLHTLVDVHAGLAGVLEPWLADTSVGPWIVLALGVNTTDKPVDPAVSDTLVYILANTVDLRVPGPAHASVRAERVDAGGTVEARRLTAAALVHVLTAVTSVVVPGVGLVTTRLAQYMFAQVLTELSEWLRNQVPSNPDLKPVWQAETHSKLPMVLTHWSPWEQAFNRHSSISL